MQGQNILLYNQFMIQQAPPLLETGTVGGDWYVRDLDVGNLLILGQVPVWFERPVSTIPLLLVLIEPELLVPEFDCELAPPVSTFDVPVLCDVWIGRIETFIGVGWAKTGNLGPSSKKVMRRVCQPMQTKSNHFYCADCTL